MRKIITLTRKEMNKRFNIDKNLWNRRHDDLLNYLNDFMSVVERKKGNKYLYDIEGFIPDTIPPIPRKNDIQAKLKDYETYTISALGNEFKPNSKAKVARDAIDDFGYDRYGHISVEAIAKRYVGPAFTEYGETNGKYVWVWSYDYSILTKEELGQWRAILEEEHINEKEAVNAFIKYAEGEDITKEVNYYKVALERCKKELGGTPVHVKEWRAKM